MSIKLEKATTEDAQILHELQIKAFLPLLKRYQDHATNPACESIDKTIERINLETRGFYKILKENHLVGGVAIKHTSSDSLWIGPIFIDPDFQNQKIAQQAMTLLETLFPNVQKYELATLSKESGNIHLYQKLGYKQTGKKETISNLIDLIFFEKIIYET